MNLRNKGVMSIKDFAKFTGIKTTVIKKHLEENYPLFRIGKDKISVHMAHVILDNINAWVYY